MARKKRGERIEPTFDASAPPIEPEVRQESEPRERKRKAAPKTAAKSSEKPKKKRRSLLGGLVYWTFVLCVWGVIGGGGLVVYYASQLPPIDQLAVPKRPPNIAILAADGSLLANRGETGGRTVHAEGAAALSAEGVRRHRGPSLLRALRHRPDRHRAGACTAT